MPFDPHRRADVFLTVEEPSTVSEPKFLDAPATREITTRRRAMPHMSEYGLETRTLPQPRTELFSKLMLVQPKRWMAGLWCDRESGWHERRTDSFLSFGEARKLIAARIVELDLTPEAVERWQRSSCSTSEEVEFWHLDFSERMDKVRTYSEN